MNPVHIKARYKAQALCGHQLRDYGIRSTDGRLYVQRYYPHVTVSQYNKLLLGRKVFVTALSVDKCDTLNDLEICDVCALLHLANRARTAKRKKGGTK